MEEEAKPRPNAFPVAYEQNPIWFSVSSLSQKDTSPLTEMAKQMGFPEDKIPKDKKGLVSWISDGISLLVREEMSAKTRQLEDEVA